ncbi:MAG: ComEC/Rec2 family competence protein [Chloroflexaceae bacterium]
MLPAFLAVAWIVGILIADSLLPSANLLVGLAALGLLSTLLGRQNRYARLVGLGLLCMMLGGLRYQGLPEPTNPRGVWLLAGQGNVVVQGVIHADPQRTEEGQQLILQTEAAQINGRTVRIEGLLLFNLPPYPAYRYGQQVQLLGRVDEPRAAENPGEFDYRDYLARQNIFALMHMPLVQPLPGERGNPLLLALLEFRGHCQNILLRSLPEPQASLAAGVLLGLKSSIPDEVATSFSATGTSHILVVSGWHLSIVALMLAGFTQRLQLNRVATFWVLLAAIWLYALFVGATPSVMRAAIMASLTLLARTGERQSEPWSLLLLACFGLTLLDPQILWDIGFQLSVAATAGLFAFAQPIEEWLLRCPPLRSFAFAWTTPALTATLSAQILALPVIIYYFGSVSLISPLANVLLAPVLPVAMLLGALTLLGGLLWLKLGQLIALSAWLAFAWISEITRLLADLPWAALRLPSIPLWLVLSYYVILLGWYGWKKWAEMPDPVTAELVAEPA